ncbi:bifunctional 4-hydroxy-2-oxoglutarate aldolase/2-dehydro-3-deoxy-phosphogluconate aldolase [Microlunatus flavus]|uniref:2-dehydro-3-deoxyphosphogluconate aldolase / (4S)-4-hydroxy-2-oxoglutarate aldolase n=1 Tax=Microlunatus flavus TaxID=1036181 RepID=A0A1H9NMI3_9ACTN|nr:bifunctional 4-hydroxy-2-oxoglutarate aldolase/2-dehydro-3-deoxy-phosphogluconate aldolase [Microlunatus flavus]SER37158.1 2-dehydro-3-deoxyphosphogluconate aldolase / (4S)-4-hydroxy-2-oxoglutarate aldolase [Microlunatus flavus]
MTAGTTERDVLGALRETVVVAVLRAPSAGAAVSAVDALVAGGITGIEVTYSTPDVPAVLREVRDRHPDVLLGAGTVLTPAHAEDAVAAGAEFLVSPGTLPDLTRAMLGTGATVLSGAMTPSEVMLATSLGVHVVKLFPSSLGGPAFLKALRAPFPDVDFCPTGGVHPDNLGEWLAAGAVAVGAGGELTPAKALATDDWDTVTEAARRFRAAADAVRGSSS